MDSDNNNLIIKSTMKQIKLLTLAMVLGCTGAMAQSVVVVMKDGTQQKFGTD